MMAFSFGNAQSNKVVSAYNYHKGGKLDKAKEAIDAATVNEKSMGDAKTWFYRGNIYIDIYRSQDENYKNLDPDALTKAYEAYTKAKELDDKDRFTNEITQFMPIVGEAYFNEGANQFNDGMKALDVSDSASAQLSFDKSVFDFEKAYEIYSAAGIDDTTTIYYVSVASELAGDYPKAKKTLEQLISMNYPKPSIYSSLASIVHDQDKDVNKALEIYAAGREKYPSDLNLLLNETNLYLAEEMTEKALENLVLAAEIDTTNPTIFFAIGAKYNEVVDDTTKTDEMRFDAFDKAVEAYDKSINIKPDYFNPYYNMGALYVNRASNIYIEANKLPFEQQKKYEALVNEAKTYLEKSLPYLEKAHELEPDDISTLVSLKEIYTRLNKLDMLKIINEKLEGK